MSNWMLSTPLLPSTGSGTSWPAPSSTVAVIADVLMPPELGRYTPAGLGTMLTWAGAGPTPLVIVNTMLALMFAWVTGSTPAAVRVAVPAVV